MNIVRTLRLASLIILCAFATSCSFAPKPNPNQEKTLSAGWVNPHPPGTYAHFTAEPTYPKTYSVYRDPSLLSQVNTKNARVQIDLSRQRAVLFKDNEVAMDYPIASGTSKFPTPTGDYKIVEKIKADKRSNLYGTIYDSEGQVHKSNADITKDEVPEGGNFEGAAMPYWMRLTWSGIGMHQGRVPRNPASHGCVRMPSKVASSIFSMLDVGTPVSIVD